MASSIDATKPVDGTPVPKSEMRSNFSAAKTELNHGGFVNDPTTGLEGQTTSVIGTIYAALRNRSTHLGVEPDAAISLSAVKQHEAGFSIAASQLTGTIDPARLPVIPSQVQVVSSGAIANLTAPQQSNIGQGTVVTTTDGRRWVYTGSGSKTSEASYIELADISPDWGVITNKPATFAPSSHTHPSSQISDAGAGGISVLQAASAGAIRLLLNIEDGATNDQLASEVPFTPAGGISATNVQTALAELGTSKAGSSHQHLAVAITDLAEAVQDIVATLLVQGSNISLNYNDAAGQLTVSATGGGDGEVTLPVEDTTPIVQGSDDNTKLLRFEVDGLSTGVTRVITMPDQNVSLAPGTTFAPSSHSHTASQISDAGAAGISMLQATTAAAQRTLLNVADGATAISPTQYVSAQAGNDLTTNPKFWVGTQGEYDALTPDANTIYDIVAA